MNIPGPYPTTASYLLLVALTLAGCQTANRIKPENSTILAYSAPSASQTILTATQTQESYQGTPSSHRSVNPENPVATLPINTWAGSYQFSEVAGLQVWVYDLNLVPATADSLHGTLSIDGYQTLSRYDVRGELTGDRLTVILNGYLTDNQNTTIPVGTTLLTMEQVSREGSPEIITYWQGLKPNLSSTPETGVTFERAP